MYDSGYAWFLWGYTLGKICRNLDKIATFGSTVKDFELVARRLLGNFKFYKLVNFCVRYVFSVIWSRDH